MADNSSQMELILSPDLDAEFENSEDTENENPQLHQAFITPRQHSVRTISILIIAGLFLFALGSLIGYGAHPKVGGVSPDCTDPEPFEGLVQNDPGMDWSSLTALFRSKLTTASIDKILSEFSSDSHEAGLSGDTDLGEKVLKKFQEFKMNPWTDSHMVTLQTQPRSEPNSVTFYNTTYSEAGYLAYSATGSVTGAVLYAHYGQEEDLRQLRALNISCSGRILLLRAGQISLAEKVSNAVAVNASAVLIYPDPADYPFNPDTDLYGHVHAGTGDPYTPGFPSSNHTHFPATQSPGLPSIPAQSIRASTAAAILRKLEDPEPPLEWAAGGLPDVGYMLGGSNDLVSVKVNNIPTDTEISNVFGVIKGFVDSDRYVVIGAQRDAWGPGFAKSTVGTSLLLELARVLTDMVKNDGFRPRRSIVFASWSAGEYGAVGATEWLEGYLPSLNIKAVSYISLDGVVTGSSFKSSASPMMYDLIQSTLKEISAPSDPNRSLYSEVGGASWEAKVMEPMGLTDPAYPFQTFSGIPSVSLRFTQNKTYPFFGTVLDTRANLEAHAPNMLGLAKATGEMAGQMALRLVHDHLLRLRPERYISILRMNAERIRKKVRELHKSGRLSEALQMEWFSSASGSYSRATSRLMDEMQNSDRQDPEQCRIINDRIMRVERNLLSPYASPRESPFRHLVLGSGPHTLEALHRQLMDLNESDGAEMDLLKNQFALVTWTIQSCANALAGDMWDLDNRIQ